MSDLGWKPEPHWPVDAELLERAVRNGGLSRTRQRWVVMMETFGVGATVAHALCRRFGLDPDECKERPHG